jgi:hypothetical protein
MATYFSKYDIKGATPNPGRRTLEYWINTENSRTYWMLCDSSQEFVV